MIGFVLLLYLSSACCPISSSPPPLPIFTVSFPSLFLPSVWCPAEEGKKVSLFSKTQVQLSVGMSLVDFMDKSAVNQPSTVPFIPVTRCSDQQYQRHNWGPAKQVQRPLFEAMGTPYVTLTTTASILLGAWRLPSAVVKMSCLIFLSTF